MLQVVFKHTMQLSIKSSPLIQVVNSDLQPATKIIPRRPVSGECISAGPQGCIYGCIR